MFYFTAYGNYRQARERTQSFTYVFLQSLWWDCAGSGDRSASYRSLPVSPSSRQVPLQSQAINQRAATITTDPSSRNTQRGRGTVGMDLVERGIVATRNINDICLRNHSVADIRLAGRGPEGR